MVITIGLIIKAGGQIVAVVIPLYKYFTKDLKTTGVKILAEDLGKIDDALTYIFENTKADRFILFFGTNGWGKMKYATAILERHKKNDKSKGAVNKFVKLNVDAHYLGLIKKAESFGVVELQVLKMGVGDLKNIYLSEGIWHSKIYFLLRKKNTFFKHHIFYCSFATHSKIAFTSYEKILIRGKIEILKSIIK